MPTRAVTRTTTTVFVHPRCHVRLGASSARGLPAKPSRTGRTRCAARAARPARTRAAGSQSTAAAKSEPTGAPGHAARREAAASAAAAPPHPGSPSHCPTRLARLAQAPRAAVQHPRPHPPPPRKGFTAAQPACRPHRPVRPQAPGPSLPGHNVEPRSRDTVPTPRRDHARHTSLAVATMSEREHATCHADTATTSAREVKHSLI
jgi:hypothetical protein